LISKGIRAWLNAITEEDKTGQSAKGRGQQFNAIDGGLLLLTPDEPPLLPCIENSQSHMERLVQIRNAASIDIDKKLNSKKTILSPRTIVRYEVIKSFMKRQRVVMKGDSGRSIAYTIRLSFGKR
jgi:hypothetical protein